MVQDASFLFEKKMKKKEERRKGEDVGEGAPASQQRPLCMFHA